MASNNSDKLWGGRFSQGSHELTDLYNESISFDRRLYKEDIAGSKAHANMLAASKIISEEDRDLIISGLTEIEREIDTKEFDFRIDREDIHLNIEARLTERIGEAGGRLHTGRSRNDQIATDMRLFVRAACDATVDALIELREVLLAVAKSEERTIMPGYTHMQRAQPILLSHHLQAYESMFVRDTERFLQARIRTNRSPLGTGALAGVSYDIDREATARELGFDEVIPNSIDAVSDRDFVYDYHSAASLLMVHISRLSEEIILWATSEFQFIILDERFSTGSSIMPQKKNPDLAELARGKSARVVGNLVQILTLLKSQPLAYNKDMQEDKEPLFDSVDTVLATLQVLSAMLPTCQFDREIMALSAEANFALATDYADYLTKKGVPFRQAHAAVGALVAQCESKGISLKELTLDQLKAAHDDFDEDALQIDLNYSLSARNASGGTAPEAVASALNEAGERLQHDRQVSTSLKK